MCVCRRFVPFLSTALLCLAATSDCRATLVTYLDEADYLAALADLGYGSVSEGFEDGSVWGGARTTISSPKSAPSVTSQGVTWQSDLINGNVTTSEGAAHSGRWGFYSDPHGDFTGPDHTDDVRDGFGGTSNRTLYGVGGWIRTGTPYAGISLFLDGVAIDFGDAPDGGDSTIVETGAKFWGVIDTAGFHSFLWQETEGEFEDQKIIFADDFTFAVNATSTPEPTGMALMGLSSLTMAGLEWRRRANAAPRA